MFRDLAKMEMSSRKLKMREGDFSRSADVVSDHRRATD